MSAEDFEAALSEEEVGPVEIGNTGYLVRTRTRLYAGPLGAFPVVEVEEVEIEELADER